MEQFIMDYEPDHLCQTCRFIRKCPRYKYLVNRLNEIEIRSFENWAIDVSVFFNVSDCDLYKVNWELMDNIKIEITYNSIDNDDEEDDENE